MNIYPNKVLESLRKGRISLGGWIFSGSPVIAEIMAMSGFEWVCIDAEHTQVSKETAMSMIVAIERHGAEPFVRIARNDEVECKLFLDLGARGILVPMIKSPSDVEQAIHYTKYAPAGSRSFALPRAAGYGAYAEEYFRKANESILLGIMIEHIDALKDLDKILSYKEIDTVLVGPYDLSGSMGIPGKFSDPSFKEAMENIQMKTREHRLAMGMHEVHPTPEKLRAHADSGYQFIACGMDTLFIMEKARELTKAIES